MRNLNSKPEFSENLGLNLAKNSRRTFLANSAKFGLSSLAFAGLGGAFLSGCDSENSGSNSANSNAISSSNSAGNSTSNSAENSANSGSNPAQNDKANSVLAEHFTLANGVKVPKIGLGLWRIEDSKVPGVIKAALDVGYRHFDSAQAYANEAGTGLGVRNSSLKRDEIFVTTKVAAEHKSYEAARSSIDESLKKLGLDYIDLMLIHAPQPWSDFRGGDYFEGNVAAWRALEAAYEAGKCRAIGVSNFLQKDLENIFANCKIKPMVNQILTHIGNTPFDLIEYCKAQNILVEAYSPIAHGELLKDERLVKMATKYGVSVPQLCIRYALQIGTLPLPKSANPAHIASNAQVDFVIADADMKALRELKFKDYGEHSYFPVFSK